MSFLNLANMLACQLAGLAAHPLLTSILLAQEDAAPNADAPQSPIPWWLPIALIGMLLYFMLIRPQSKERRAHAEMLQNLKKNDRVVTIGGIYGTVVEVKPDRVVLRVDESGSTRMQISRGAVSRLVTDDKDSDKESQSPGKENFE